MTTAIHYPGVDPATIGALAVPADDIVARAPTQVEVFADEAAMVAAFAAYIADDYAAALAAGRTRVAFIVPVGPVGQSDILAELSAERDLPLDRLTLVVMDEYLDAEGRWIDAGDPLSFRGHIERHLTARLPEDRRPTVVVPDPRDLDAVGRAIDAHGGLDVSYAGVGITGHLAFNAPVPGRDDPDWFAGLGTRIVALSPETRLINSVSATRGNTLRVPHGAVTVGMREILSAGRLRIFMNRPWQCAAIRRLLFGPVTAAFPASLAQRHAKLSLHVVENVLALPEPGLR